MNRYYLKITFLLLSLTPPAHASFLLKAAAMTDSSYGMDEINNAPDIPPFVGPLDKAKTIVDKGSEALNFLGRDAVLKALYAVAEAANNLVKNGITIHLRPNKAIPQIGFCTAGVLASACGLGVITHTALQKNTGESRRKYLIGASMAAVGVASLLASNQLMAKE